MGQQWAELMSKFFMRCPTHEKFFSVATTKKPRVLHEGTAKIQKIENRFCAPWGNGLDFFPVMVLILGSD